MNCEEVQELLLTCDSPAAEVMPAGMRDHLASCAVCSELRAKLVKLEKSASRMQYAAGASEARSRFEVLMRSRGLSGRNRSASRSWLAAIPRRVYAVAAILLIGLGSALVLLREGARPDRQGDINRGDGEAVIEQLVAWNVDLGSASTPAERNKLYADRIDELRNRVQQARLDTDDAKLAATLVDGGKWLCEHDDPLAEAERFTETADKLSDVIDSASASNKPERMKVLSRSYMMLMKRGVDRNLDRVRARGFLDPQRQGRIAKLVQRDAIIAQRVEMLLRKQPNASFKEINALLDQIQARRQMIMMQRKIDAAKQ